MGEECETAIQELENALIDYSTTPAWVHCRDYIDNDPF